MTTLTVRRLHVPFWQRVGLAVVARLTTSFVSLPLATWMAYDLPGLEQGSQLGDAFPESSIHTREGGRTRSLARSGRAAAGGLCWPARRPVSALLDRG
jgi:hypothetical protein